MLKKTMVIFMAACLVIRGSALIYLLINVDTVIPNSILGCTALTCSVFAALLVHYFLHGIKRRDMEFAFILNSATVIINMFTLRYTVPSTLTPFEYLTAGSLFEVVASVVFIVLSRQRTHMLMAKKGL